MSAFPVATASVPTHSRTARLVFWIAAALAIPVLTVAWVWYGMAQSEAQEDQGKALAAGTTMAGFAELVGGVPLAAAHVIVFGVLLGFGWFGFRRPGRGVLAAVLVVVVASAAGIAIAQVLFAGQLFVFGIGNFGTYVP